MSSNKIGKDLDKFLIDGDYKSYLATSKKKKIGLNCIFKRKAIVEIEESNISGMKSRDKNNLSKSYNIYKALKAESDISYLEALTAQIDALNKVYPEWIEIDSYYILVSEILGMPLNSIIMKMPKIVTWKPLSSIKIILEFSLNYMSAAYY